VTIVANVKTEKADFVLIVTADGDPIPGFTEPVPSTWIGTPLLPEGAKKDPKAAAEPAPTPAMTEDQIEAEVARRVAEALAAAQADAGSGASEADTDATDDKGEKGGDPAPARGRRSA